MDLFHFSQNYFEDRLDRALDQSSQQEPTIAPSELWSSSNSELFGGSYFTGSVFCSKRLPYWGELLTFLPLLFMFFTCLIYVLVIIRNSKLYGLRQLFINIYVTMGLVDAVIYTAYFLKYMVSPCWFGGIFTCKFFMWIWGFTYYNMILFLVVILVEEVSPTTVSLLNANFKIKIFIAACAILLSAIYAIPDAMFSSVYEFFDAPMCTRESLSSGVWYWREFIARYAILPVTVLTTILAIISIILRRCNYTSDKMNSDELSPQFGVAFVLAVAHIAAILTVDVTRYTSMIYPQIVPTLILICSKRHRQGLFCCCGCCNNGSGNLKSGDGKDEKAPLNP